MMEWRKRKNTDRRGEHRQERLNGIDSGMSIVKSIEREGVRGRERERGREGRRKGSQPVKLGF